MCFAIGATMFLEHVKTRCIIDVFDGGLYAPGIILGES
jgi:hypothetical protein